MSMGSGKAGLRGPRFSIIASIRLDAPGRKAFQSVQRQTFRDFEIIFLTEDPFDRPETVIGDVRGTVLQVGHSTSSSARNEALARATGQVVGFITGEDVWHPHFLSYHARLYDLFPETLFGFTNFYRERPSGSGPVNQRFRAPDAPNALLQMVIRPFVENLSCFTAPLAFMRAIGGFNLAAPACPDTDLYVRLLAGPENRKRLACYDRPVVGLPQIGLLTHELAEPNPSAVAQERAAFLDHVFAYPFMQRFEQFRAACQINLADENSVA